MDGLNHKSLGSWVRKNGKFIRFRALFRHKDEKTSLLLGNFRVTTRNKDEKKFQRRFEACVELEFFCHEWKVFHLFRVFMFGPVKHQSCSNASD